MDYLTDVVVFRVKGELGKQHGQDKKSKNLQEMREKKVVERPRMNAGDKKFYGRFKKINLTRKKFKLQRILVVSSIEIILQSTESYFH